MRRRLAGTAVLWVVMFWGTCPAAAQDLPFVRGDANQDSRVDLSDPISLLFHLFVPGNVTPCEKAADVNDDGLLQISDAIFGLQYLFAGGPPPPAPFGACGFDPTADGLTCVETHCADWLPRVILSDGCAADPDLELEWELTSLDPLGVTLDWVIEGSLQSGTVELPALGSVVLTTQRVPGTNELVLSYRGRDVARLAQVKIIISEIMASNAASLADEDGDSSDWIELLVVHTPCSAPLDLDGWYLTDEEGWLDKWRLSSVTLNKGDHLVVFASDKDRVVEGAELHTNFNLDKNGEYLALVAADGKTVVDEFVGGYPEQVTDVSYGPARSTATLVEAGSDVLYHVPTAADAGLGDDWADPDYTPTGWNTGATGLGFSGVAAEGFTVTCIKSTEVVSFLNSARGVLEDPDKQSWVETETASVIDYFSSGLDRGNYTNDNAFPGLAFEDVDDFVVHVVGSVLIPEAGIWSFGVNSDDGFGLELTNGQQTFTMEYAFPRGAGDTIQSFTFPEAGPYELSLVYFERSGTAELELFAAQGNHPTFNFDHFRLVGDIANGGLGLLAVAADVRTDLGSEMQGISTSLWARAAFDVEDAETFNELVLRMKYEDGFVAYLNGYEVASRNAPDSPRWNSAASSDRPVENALLVEEINLTGYRHLLESGPNVLAIHGLNDAASDENFLILPELIASGSFAQHQYMTTPTPGGPNVAGAADFVRSVAFSVEHGFYDASFPLELSTATLGADIRYTLNGSTPTETTGEVYTGPLTIDETTVIRAAAFRPEYLDASVTTSTYVFVSDVKTQSPNGQAPGPGWPTGRVNGQWIDYGMDPQIVNSGSWGPLIEDALLAIPTISLVTDLGNLFSSSTGIYVNAQNDGRAWERRTSVELIHPDGTEGFAIDAGLRIRGAWSRQDRNPKHAFRLIFRNAYGAGKLQYALFGGEGVDAFDKIDLRTSQNFSWAFEGDEKNTLIRDVFSRDVQREMHQPYTRSRYYHLYLNGHYWGVFQTQERADADFAASYLHGTEHDYDVIKNDSSGSRDLHATDGTMAAYQRLYNAAVARFTSDEALYAVLGLQPDGTPDPFGERLIEPENLIDYMICTYYTGDPDAPVSCWAHFSNNVFAIYNHERPDGFTWFRHDAEHSLGANGGVTEARLLTNGRDRSVGEQWRHFNPAWLNLRLTEHPEYRLQFADRVARYFFNGGILSEDANVERWMARADQLELAIIAESARWGDAQRSSPRTKNDWEGQNSYMLNSFFPQRLQIVTNNMRSVGLFPQQAIVSFNQHGGEVAPGFELLMSQSNGTTGTIYYALDGSDPREWGGDIGQNASAFSPPVLLNETTTVRARVYDNGTWGAMTEARFWVGIEGLVINEIMASNHTTLEDPDELGEFPDWIEIYNGTSGTIDLGGMYLSDDLHDLTKWRIAPDVLIDPGQHLVVLADDDGTQGVLHTNYQLSASGESIALVDSDGTTIIDSIVFNAQLDDISYGRFPDGDAMWGLHQAATPGSSNQPFQP